MTKIPILTAHRTIFILVVMFSFMFLQLRLIFIIYVLREHLLWLLLIISPKQMMNNSYCFWKSINIPGFLVTYNLILLLISYWYPSKLMGVSDIKTSSSVDKCVSLFSWEKRQEKFQSFKNIYIDCNLLLINDLCDFLTATIYLLSKHFFNCRSCGAFSCFKYNGIP